MIKFLIIAVIVFEIYSFIDCAMTPQEKIRKGRQRPGRIIPPDDDPDFLRKL